MPFPPVFRKLNNHADSFVSTKKQLQFLTIERTLRFLQSHAADGIADIEHSILGWLAIGLIAGILGKLIMPGRDPGGIVVTIIIGIAGALLAGFVAQSMGWEIGGGWRNYAAATAGAVVLLALYRMVLTRRGR